MSKLVGLAALAIVVGASSFANAAPLGPRVAKVTVADNDTLVPSKRFTAADALRRKPSFSVDRIYKTRSGGTITGQQFLDLANKLQAAAEKGGCTLGSGKRCNFAATKSKLGPAQLNQTARLAGYRLNLKKTLAPPTSPGRSPGIGHGEGKQRAPAVVAAQDPLGFAWGKEWGDRSTGAAYVGVEFGNGGSSSSSSCGGAAYAGVYLFGMQKEVIRLEGEANSTPEKFSASAELFVLGDSVWSKAGSITADQLKFEKTFRVQQSFTYWGLVTINLTAKATGSAWISASINGVSKPGEFTCTLNVTPSARAKVDGSADVSLLGYGSLSAASVGVEADLVLADVRMPITAAVSAKNQSGKVSFTESLSADINAKFLVGSLDVYFMTIFPLDGETIFDWDMDKFSFTLLDWEGTTYNQSLFQKSATQTL
jgi:hypothetical protein